MTPLYGWAQIGKRVIDHVPHPDATLAEFVELLAPQVSVSTANSVTCSKQRNAKNTSKTQDTKTTTPRARPNTV